MAKQRHMRRIAKTSFRVCLPLLVLLGCGVLLSGKISTEHLRNLPAQLAGIPWSAWIMAAGFTIISLWAVGRYDGVAHAHFSTRIPNTKACWSGTIAISLAQTLGFGLFTGALARWRMLPDLTLAAAFQISAFVSISFVAAWALVTALANIVLPGPEWAFWPAMAVLAAVPFGLWLMFRFPALHFGRLAATRWSLDLRLPSLASVGAIIVWSVLDTFAAAGAFFVLLPLEAQISLAAFIPLYLLALGAALISNTPGGIGPFEVMILGLMPHVPLEALLASILAFRLIYYVVPATFAAIVMFVPFRAHPPSKPVALPNLALAANAELCIIKQNGGYVLPNLQGASAVWPTGQTLTALCNPISGPIAAALSALRYEAVQTGRFPMLYKCNRKTAWTARQNGWKTMHISDDAILDTDQFQLDVPARRGLRRKLRAAVKQGVTVRGTGPNPWPEMSNLDRIWQEHHGHARGGTMGRFCPHYLQDHYISRAYQGERLIAFASFQRSASEWCLDVMRHGYDMPDGTMHALVVHAIEAARTQGITRLSLAATPACPDPSSAFYRWAAMKAVAQAGGSGLRQFKSAFAPRWEPRYAAAQSRMALCIGLADITKEVHRPAPLASPMAASLASVQVPSRFIHNVDENNELAPARAS